jgi:hypothetical protein
MARRSPARVRRSPAATRRISLESVFADNAHAIAALRAARAAALDARMALRLLGNEDEAQQVQRRAKQLSNRIDVMIGKMMTDWIAETSSLTSTLVAKQADLDAAVAALRKNQKVAQQVVSILGILDDAIAIAAKLIP